MPFRTKSVTSTEAGVTAAPYDEKRTSLAFFNTTTGRVSVLSGSIDRAETDGFPVNGNGGSLTFNRLGGSDPRDIYFLKSAVAAGSLVIRIIEEYG